MPLPGFAELAARASRQSSRIGVAAAGGADVTVLQALSLAARQGWVRPLVTGDPAAIASAAEQAEVDLTHFEVVASDEPAETAAQLIADGRAAILMKGQIDTPSLVRPLFDPRYGLRRGKTICQVVLMEIVDQQRRFLLADTGVTIRPNLKQKGDILRYTLQVARGLGLDTPRAALLAATEKFNPAMPETIDIVDLCRQAEAGDFGPAHVRGPLSFDVAYASDAGQKKQLAGEVVGAADALVFPDLLSANLTVKAIMYTARCQFGGVLAGAGCPVVFMSRSDTVETRLNSLAYALALATTRSGETNV
ncbi:MAG: phosphate acyltransferase [Planctomycetaceae bacterium]|jgi:phosphotransacetylase